MSDLEWRQELLYQRFATWEPKHTVPTVKELEHELWREKVIAGQRRMWAAHMDAMLESKFPNIFASFVRAASGEDKPRA